MTLPLYAILERSTRGWWRRPGTSTPAPSPPFRKIMFPLSMPGVVAGTLLTFIPAAGDYVNADAARQPATHDDRQRHRRQFLRVVDYPTAAALSVTLMAPSWCWCSSTSAGPARRSWYERPRRRPASAGAPWRSRPRVEGRPLVRARHAITIFAALAFIYLFIPIAYTSSSRSTTRPVATTRGRGSRSTSGRTRAARRTCASRWDQPQDRRPGDHRRHRARTMVAFALARHRFHGRSPTNLTIFLPMATPEVVMGASLLALFLNLKINLGFNTIVIAHVMFCISFVVVTVKARIASLDPRLEQAAMDLYADEMQTFRRVTLPLVAPGILAGGAAGVLAVVRRLHHHELQLGHRRTPSRSSSTFLAARHPGSGQRDRLGDVLHRPLRRLVGQVVTAAGRGGGLTVTSPPSTPRRPPSSTCGTRRTGSTGRSPTPARARRARDRRPGRRRRRLHRAVDGAARQGARPGPRRRADRGPHRRAGRPPGATAASGGQPDPRPAQRPGAVPARTGAPGAARPARTSTRSRRRSSATASTATSSAPARSTSPPRHWQADELRELPSAARARPAGRVARRRRSARPGRLADLPRRGAGPRRRRHGRPGPAGAGACARPACGSASGSTRTRQVTALDKDGAGVRPRDAVGRVRAAPGRARHQRVPPLLHRLGHYMVPVYDYSLVTEPLSAEQRAASGGPTGKASATSATCSTTTGSPRTTDPVGRLRRRSTTSAAASTTELERRPATLARLAEHFFATFPQLEGLVHPRLGRRHRHLLPVLRVLGHRPGSPGGARRLPRVAARRRPPRSPGGCPRTRRTASRCR